MTSAWAGWRRIDIPVDRSGGVRYIPCYGAPAEQWGPLPVSRLASRKIPIEKNIKRWTGPALYVFSLLGRNHTGTLLYSKYSKDEVIVTLMLKKIKLTSTKYQPGGLHDEKYNSQSKTKVVTLDILVI
jgi:hypothetical protein